MFLNDIQGLSFSHKNEVEQMNTSKPQAGNVYQERRKTKMIIIINLFKTLTFLTNFGVSISMNPERTASRKLFWLLNVMRPEPRTTI